MTIHISDFLIQGVQLRIEIMDYDGNINEDELIDTLLINYDLPIGKQSPRKNYTGIYI